MLVVAPMSRGIRYADVRGAVDQLLRNAEREYLLERKLTRSVSSDPTFDGDRKFGVTAFALATICFRVPEARKILETMIASKAREIALMEERSKKDGKSRTVQVHID